MMDVYFGNKADHLQKNGRYDLSKFGSLREKLKLPKIFFLKQVHGKFVYHLEKPPEKNVTCFAIEGDAIITQLKNVGIGVVTADCVPISVLDSVNQAIGIVHAGWQGLYKKILSETLLEMKNKFSTNLSTIKILIGPSADQCCYEVTDEFKNYFSSDLLETRREKIFFSPKKAAIHELEKVGILKDQIDLSKHCCTICNPLCCSYRRDKTLAGRSPSVVSIRA